MNQQQPIGWTVTAQTETMRQDARNQLVRGMLVTFQLTNGQQGSVFVPDTQYNAEAVRAAIRDRAQHMLNVSNLSG